MRPVHTAVGAAPFGPVAEEIMRGILISGCILGVMLAAGCASSGTGATKASPPVTQPSALAAVHDDDAVHIYVDEVRADLSDGKIEIINQVMKLSDAEDKIFWPIYSDYEQELFALGDKRLDIMNQFITAQNNHTLTDAKAAELTTSYFEFEQDRLDLVKKYNDILSKALSPIRAAQFAQIEHRIDTVVDLMIASQTPLVQQHVAGGKVEDAATTKDAGGN
jgi:hypothetical protein